MPLKKILLAGGGTAGHVEPALAVGTWIRSHHPEVTCEFLGTSSGLESSLVPAAGFTLRVITKAPLPRSLSLTSLIWPVKMVKSLRETSRALKSVDLLVGFGGYVSSSAYIVARFKKIPMIAHEANALPGWANKLGVRWGARPLIAFEETRTTDETWRNATLVGIPLREEVVKLASSDAVTRNEIRTRKAAEWGFNPDKPIVVVFGGSQGSLHINKVIAESRELITRSGIQVVHAVGRNNPLPESSSGYKAVHYFTDLPEAYVAADVVICRSGAVTCHEIGALGSYALLIPLPVGNGEQRLNAQMIINAGQGSVIANKEFTSRWLGDHLIGLITAGKKMRDLSHASLVPLDGASHIGKIAVEALGEGK